MYMYTYTCTCIHTHVPLKAYYSAIKHRKASNFSIQEEHLLFYMYCTKTVIKHLIKTIILLNDSSLLINIQTLKASPVLIFQHDLLQFVHLVSH